VTVTALTLTDSVRGLTSAVKPRDGIAFQGLSLDSTVRAVAGSRPQADGSLDTTSWLGAGAVSLSLNLYTGDRALLDELAVFMDPSYRPYLIVDDDGWAGERRVMLRPDNWTKAIATGAGAQRVVQMQWQAPDGFAEDNALTIVTLTPLLTPGTGLPFKAGPGLPLDNYLTGQSATFVGGNGNWNAAGNCAVANDATDGHSTGSSLKLTSTAAGDMFAASSTAGNILTIAGVPCSGGDQLNVGAWFKALTSARACQVGADCYDAAGVLAGSVYDTVHAVTDSTSAWSQAAGTVTAPAGSHRARLSVKVLATGAGGEAHRMSDPFISRMGQQATVAAALDWPAGSAAGDSLVSVPGTMRTWWTAKLYGPCTGPKLANDTVGADLRFTDSLVLAAGDYVEVSARDRTAYLLSDTSLSRAQFLDWGATAWWALVPGDNLLRYHPTSAGAGAQAEITFRTAWML
jgi:hypothetical protein